MMRILKKINNCDVFVALSIIYSLQGLLYPQGTINQILQLLMIIWGLVVSFRYFFRPQRIPKLLKATALLLIMYCVYGCIEILFDNPLLHHISELPARYIYLQVSLRSLLNIFVFYHYSSNGQLTSTRICVYATIILLTLIPKYYYQQTQIMLLSERDEVTNNIGYTFLALIPAFYFFNKRTILQYILLTVTLLYLIMAMKRGAILIGVLAAIILVFSNVTSDNRKQKRISLVFSTFLIIAVALFVTNLLSESSYFVQRIEQTIAGDSSGRDDLYKCLWDILISEQDLFYILFGRGADATWALVGNYAHQDWLETFCNNGLIGVIILSSFYYHFFIAAYSSKKILSRNYYFAFITLFIIAFSKTLFSMSIQSMEVAISMVLGFLLYNYYTSRKALEKCH